MPNPEIKDQKPIPLFFSIGLCLFGIGMIIYSSLTGAPYKFEGSIYFLFGVVILSLNMVLIKLDIYNLKWITILNHIVELLKTKPQKDNFLDSMFGSMFDGTKDGATVKIVHSSSPEEIERFFKNSPFFDNSIFETEPNKEKLKIEVEKLMAATNLSEEDATTALLLNGKSVEELQKGKKDAVAQDKYELAQFIEKMIEKAKRN